jgi:hypothetical protein
MPLKEFAIPKPFFYLNLSVLRKSDYAPEEQKL